MSPRIVTHIVLLVLSVAIGVAIGEWFHHLYIQAMPPMAQAQFTAQSARVAHWLYGAGVGLVLYLWALVGMAVARMLQMMSKPAKT